MSLLVLFQGAAGSVIPLSLGMEGDSALGTSLVAVRPLASGLVGDGYLSPAIVATRVLSLGIVGDGYLTSSLIAKRFLALGVVGDGYLTTPLAAVRILSLSESGTGILNGSIGALRLLTQSLAGSGVLTATAIAVRTLSAAAEGDSSLDVALSPPSLALAIEGDSALEATLVNANAAPSGGGSYPPGFIPFSHPFNIPRTLEQPARPWRRRKQTIRAIAAAMQGQLAPRVGVTLTVISQALKTEARAPAAEVFPWWEHPTEDELAFILSLV